MIFSLFSDGFLGKVWRLQLSSCRGFTRQTLSKLQNQSHNVREHKIRWCPEPLRLKRRFFMVLEGFWGSASGAEFPVSLSNHALQQHSPLTRKFYSSEHWLSSRCLTSVIMRELVFPPWHIHKILPGNALKCILYWIQNSGSMGDMLLDGSLAMGKHVAPNLNYMSLIIHVRLFWFINSRADYI